MVALGLVWLAAVIVGLGALAAYDNRPAAAAQAHPTWPASARVPLASDTHTLVMFAHPRCSCTRASLTELAEILARARRRPAAYVVFITPRGAADDWALTALWRSADRIPGVTAILDAGGEEAQRFGAATSGQTLLYDRHGRLVFSGGATGSRGHAGDNAGRAAILARLGDRPPLTSASPVFGCALSDPTPERAIEEHRTHVTDRD